MERFDVLLVVLPCQVRKETQFIDPDLIGAAGSPLPSPIQLNPLQPPNLCTLLLPREQPWAVGTCPFFFAFLRDTV